MRAFSSIFLVQRIVRTWSQRFACLCFCQSHFSHRKSPPPFFPAAAAAAAVASCAPRRKLALPPFLHEQARARHLPHLSRKRALKRRVVGHTLADPSIECVDVNPCAAPIVGDTGHPVSAVLSCGLSRVNRKCEAWRQCGAAGAWAKHHPVVVGTALGACPRPRLTPWRAHGHHVNHGYPKRGWSHDFLTRYLESLQYVHEDRGGNPRV
mmetsp:Transcript_10086/g.26347  ORF Transcript_10086/g.26347 Transcript_10086/m.26347 type:complete len:209 (+) Transcript_10086:1755-2381(+)